MLSLTFGEKVEIWSKSDKIYCPLHGDLSTFIVAGDIKSTYLSEVVPGR